jgi:hypothetical protein
MTPEQVPGTRPAGYAVALAHAARGRRVFPWKPIVKPGKVKPDKQPLTEHGHLDATTDERTIIAWWKRHPDAYAGWALPEGIGLVDIDDPAAFGATGYDLPPGPEQVGTLTRPDGLHRLYRVADGRQTQGTIPGADTRVGGDGWVALYSPEAFVGEPGPAPAWFPRRNGPNGTGTAIAVTRETPARAALATGRLLIPAGQRDGDLASIAGTMIAAGATPEAVEITFGLIDAAGGIEQPAGDRVTEADFHRIAFSVAETAARRAGTEGRNAVADLAVVSWAGLMAEPPTPPPTIRPGIPKVGAVVFAGSPKVGESLWAGQTALESRLPTLLIIEEGSRAGISYRMRVQAAALGIVDPPITVMYRQKIRLDDKASVDRLRAYVAETRPALIVMDPLNRLHSADENKPSQMTPVMDALAALAYDGDGRAVVAIHHVNKPSADRRGDIWDRLRGASSIRSGTDANLILDGDRGDDRKLVGEFRDAEPLIEFLKLDRTALLFRASEAPVAPAKVDPIALRAFVEERGQVVSRQIEEQFSVSRNTAKYALRALGCDEYEGARGALTFSLSTRQ